MVISNRAWKRHFSINCARKFHHFKLILNLKIVFLTISISFKYIYTLFQHQLTAIICNINAKHTRNYITNSEAIVWIIFNLSSSIYGEKGEKQFSFRMKVMEMKAHVLNLKALQLQCSLF